MVDVFFVIASFLYKATAVVFVVSLLKFCNLICFLPHFNIEGAVVDVLGVFNELEAGFLLGKVARLQFYHCSVFLQLSKEIIQIQ